MTESVLTLQPWTKPLFGFSDSRRVVAADEPTVASPPQASRGRPGPPPHRLRPWRDAATRSSHHDSAVTGNHCRCRRRGEVGARNRRLPGGAPWARSWDVAPGPTGTGVTQWVSGRAHQEGGGLGRADQLDALLTGPGREWRTCAASTFTSPHGGGINAGHVLLDSAQGHGLK